MHDFTIRLFGKFRLFANGEPISGLCPGKAQYLLCYLLLHRNRVHSREALAALYWGESSTAQSKKYLRTTLWQLRVALKEPDEGRLLIAGSDSLQVNPGVHLFLDITEFEKAYRLSEPTTGPHLNSAQVEHLRQAAELYQGHLLEGCYEEWCLCERERFQNMYLIVLDRLLSVCEAQGDCESGRNYGTCILSHDPACERTHQRLMRLYYANGDRAGAVRQFERCKVALKQELGVQPSRQTQDLYQQICGDRPLVPAVPLLAEAKGQAIDDILSRLKSTWRILFSLQKQLEQDIRSLDRTFIPSQAASSFSAPYPPAKIKSEKDAG